MGGGREGGGRWVMKLLLQKMLTILGVGGEGDLPGSFVLLLALLLDLDIFCYSRSAAPHHSQYRHGPPGTRRSGKPLLRAVKPLYSTKARADLQIQQVSVDRW